MDNIDYCILHKIHPSIRKYVIYIWKEGKMGICSRDIQILQISSSMKNNENQTMIYANKFNVLLPYAGRYIEWEVKFCNDDLTFAPDFDLGDDSFLGELKSELICQKLPSWAHWNAADHSSLYKVLMELLTMYKLHQVCQLEEERYSRILFEYTALIGGTSVAEDQVEVYVEPSDVVQFLIALSVEYTALPPVNMKDLSELNKDVAILLITFPMYDGSNVKTQIYFPENVHFHHKLLGFRNIVLPLFTKDDCLFDYVPTIQKCLQERINEIIYIYKLKKSYVVYLLSKFPNHILEYDNSNHSKVTLLFETNSFHWLLIIEISNYFPKIKPKWTLRSIYDKSGEPATAELLNYPYRPHWYPREMIINALKYTVEIIPQFKFITFK